MTASMLELDWTQCVAINHDYSEELHCRGTLMKEVIKEPGRPQSCISESPKTALCCSLLQNGVN